MALRDRWHAFTAARARRYLAAHPTVAHDVLRQDPELAAATWQQFLEVDAARNGPTRETYPYPTSTMGFGGNNPLLRDLSKPLSFRTRDFANYPPARRAINCLTNPLVHLPWSLGVIKPLDLAAHEAPPPPTADQKARIRAATEMFQRPNDDMTWSEWLELVLEEVTVFGAGPFEVQDSRKDARPLFLWPVNAASIRINANWEPGMRGPRYSQDRGYLLGATGITNEVRLQDEDLCYPRLNPSTATPFGTGYVEIALSTLNAYMGAFDYATRRASNSTPNYMIFLGENMTLDQVRQWQHYWEVEIEGRGKILILGGGRAPDVKAFMGSGADPLYLSWQEWIVRIVAISFGLSPMKLGIERDINRSTSEVQSTDDWSTISPIAGLIKNALTFWVLHKRIGWTDLEFIWTTRNTDELQQAEILSLEYNMNEIKVDELRKAYNRPPLDDGLGDMTKTAYETAVKVALMPKPKPAAPGQARPPVAASWNPFDDDIEQLSPAELVCVRAILKEQRTHRNGTAVGA